MISIATTADIALVKSNPINATSTSTSPFQGQPNFPLRLHWLALYDPNQLGSRPRRAISGAVGAVDGDCLYGMLTKGNGQWVVLKEWDGNVEKQRD